MFNRFSKKEEIIPADELIQLLVPQLKEKYKVVDLSDHDDSIRFFFNVTDEEDHTINVKVEQDEKSDYNLWIRNPELEKDMEKKYGRNMSCWAYDSKLEINRIEVETEEVEVEEVAAAVEE